MKWLLPILSIVLATATARAQEPPVVLLLGDRHGHAVPHRTGCTHMGGGNIDIDQPSPDAVVITMTGAAVATGHPFMDSRAAMTFELDQELKVVFTDPDKVKSAKLTMDARVIGLLRSQRTCHNTK